MEFSSFVALLPPPLQFAAYCIAAVVTAILVRTEYRKKRDAEPAQTDLIIAGGSLTDMKPIREMNEHLAHLVSHTASLAISQRATADAIAAIGEIMKREADGDRMRDEAERIFGDYLNRLKNAEQPPPPPRRR